MKKIFSDGLVGALLLLTTTIGVKGQLAGNNTQLHDDYSFSKKADPKSPFAFVGRNNMNVRAVRNFTRSYQNVSGENWFELKDGFVVMFKLDNVDYQVAYNKKGNLLHTIRTYSEVQMPQELRHIVKSTYYDYEINLVHEIELSGNPAVYLIQLQSKTELVSLRSYNGEIEVVQKFIKSR